MFYKNLYKLTYRKIIPKEQHGFLPGRSTLNNFRLSIDDWTRAWGSDVSVNVIRLIVASWKNFSIWEWGMVVCRGKSVLCTIGHFVSEWEEHISIWLPGYQRCSLGNMTRPYYLSLHTTDLPSSIRSLWTLFADDSKIYKYPLWHWYSPRWPRHGEYVVWGMVIAA